MLPFHRFKGAETNTFDDAVKDAFVVKKNILIESRMTSVAPLRELVGNHLSPKGVVDYLNIDIEGREMAALATYDFQMYPPSVITIEDQTLNLHEIEQSSIFAFMRARGYSLISHLLITSLYIKDM